MNSKPGGKVGVSQTDADKQFSTDKVVDVDLFLGDECNQLVRINTRRRDAARVVKAIQLVLNEISDFVENKHKYRRDDTKCQNANKDVLLSHIFCEQTSTIFRKRSAIVNPNFCFCAFVLRKSTRVAVGLFLIPPRVKSVREVLVHAVSQAAAYRVELVVAWGHLSGKIDASLLF